MYNKINEQIEETDRKTDKGTEGWELNRKRQ